MVFHSDTINDIPPCQLRIHRRYSLKRCKTSHKKEYYRNDCFIQ